MQSMQEWETMYEQPLFREAPSISELDFLGKLIELNVR
jgi:hypothetical protein